MCDQEWDIPLGEVKACGGDVMMRCERCEAAGGYRDDLIAGEEPELCVRLRAAGWKIWRLDHEMTLHDAAMLHFAQWWRRQMRSGYAFAQGAKLHGRAPERHWVWESRRALIWGVGFPLARDRRDLRLGDGGGPCSFWSIRCRSLRRMRTHARTLAHPAAIGVFRAAVTVSRGGRPAQIFHATDGSDVAANSSSTSAMRIAYLINQYPKVSHSFIRREILALERQGFEIMRISIRGWDE